MVSIGLPTLVNLCLLAFGRVVVNNTHCRSIPGDVDVVMSNSVLSIAILIVSSSRWGSFLDVVDSDLGVKLTELWIKNSKPPVDQSVNIISM